MIDLVAEFSDHRAVEGWSGGMLGILSPFATKTHVSGDEIVFKEGDPADGFFLVLAGRVALEIVRPRQNVVLGTIKQGGLLGISWFWPDAPWRFTARAVEDSELLKFDGEGVRAAMQDDHSFGFELLGFFIEALTDRLQSARFQLLDVYGEGI